MLLNFQPEGFITKGMYFKMAWYFYLLGAVTLIAAIVLVIVVILQEGNSKGVGVVSGGADTFFSKNKARSIDAFLSRWTKFFAIVFFVLVLAMNVVAYATAEKTADTTTTEDLTNNVITTVDEVATGAVVASADEVLATVAE